MYPVDPQPSVLRAPAVERLLGHPYLPDWARPPCRLFPSQRPVSNIPPRLAFGGQSMRGCNRVAMWENAVWAVIGALLGATLATLKDWLWYRTPTHGGIRIEIEEERGPVGREYGFTEKAVKVTVKNQSDVAIEIQDIRLMFTKTHGVPVMPEAPALRSHSVLPETLASGAAQSWYVPAEKLASLLRFLSWKPVSEDCLANLRPRVTSATGKVYRGSAFRFSKDVESHWP